MKRKIIGAKADDKGNITHVKIKGNTNYTGLETAMNMTDKGIVDAVHIKRNSKTKEHLRTPPDNKKRNNLDDMANK